MSFVQVIFLFIFYFVFRRSVTHAQKRQACQGFHSAVMFSTGSQYGGIASCFVSSLYPHVCFHVRHDGKIFSLCVGLSQPHKSLYRLQYVLSIFFPTLLFQFYLFIYYIFVFSKSQQGVIFLQPWSEPHIRCN